MALPPWKVVLVLALVPVLEIVVVIVVVIAIGCCRSAIGPPFSSLCKREPP
jgi:hypothetical protein